MTWCWLMMGRENNFGLLGGGIRLRNSNEVLHLSIRVVWSGNRDVHHSVPFFNDVGIIVLWRGTADGRRGDSHGMVVFVIKSELCLNGLGVRWEGNGLSR